MGDAEGKGRKGAPEKAKYVEKILLETVPPEKLKATVLKIATKNEDGRLVYLPTEALESLTLWRERTSAVERDKVMIVARIFHRDGEPVKSFPYVAWRSACKRAKIPGRRPHDFRRTMARNYRRSGEAEGVIMKNRRMENPQRLRALQHRGRGRSAQSRRTRDYRPERGKNGTNRHDRVGEEPGRSIVSA